MRKHPMKRLLGNPWLALAAGLLLRLFFVFRFPSDSGDTPLYEELAANWLRHGAFAMRIDGLLTPVDLRMPGYPGFLAAIYALSGHTGAAARLAVLLAQVGVDLLSGLLIAALAALLARLTPWRAHRRRIFVAALWLSLLCPFIANYTAVPLTEVLAAFLTAATLLALLALLAPAGGGQLSLFQSPWAARNAESLFAVLAGFLTGLGTLFRPEAPLLLAVSWIVLAFVWLRRRRWAHGLRLLALSALGCLLPLLPWAARNALTLHEAQLLTPRYTQLPGEIVPRGFIAWEKTWLWRFRDVYLVSWKLDQEPILIAEIPAGAFDTPAEKARIAAALAAHNRTLIFTEEEDAVFAAVARERTARHPLRTLVRIPLARAAAMWFTPRIELLPFSGNVFPLREAFADDPIDLSVTAGFFLLNFFYVGLAVWGALRLWRGDAAARPAVALLAGYVLLRTAFLTTIETPEPRYVIPCFPILLALAAQLFAPRSDSR